MVMMQEKYKNSPSKEETNHNVKWQFLNFLENYTIWSSLFYCIVWSPRM